MSEILVSGIEAVKKGLGLSDLFIGVIVIAIIGNAAEHSSAVLMALRNKMNVAWNIAAGASSQVALLVAPLLVFMSLFAPKRMSLVFTGMEIAGIALAVIVLEMVAYDGETNWFEGVELIAVYLIMAIAFFFVPMGVSGH
jgi:Ca2+:H+ antiporter